MSDPGAFVTTIEFQLSLLLFVALAGYLLASRINQSAVIGEILVGVIVGPSVLGLITYTDFVQAFATLGAIVILFVIGFEVDLRDILDWKYGVIGLVGVIVPWIGGYLLALPFGYGVNGAIFIGTAMTATSIAITANVLRELDVLDTEVSRAIIGTAIVDDILALIALAISADVVSGAFSVSGVAITIMKALVFIGIAGAVGTFYISRLIRWMDHTRIARKYPEFVFIFAIMFAFFYAACAELVGISAIVGAFIAGVSFRGINLDHSFDIKEGAEYLYIIFAAVFFVSLGILADFSALTFMGVVFLILLTLVAVATKVVGCGIPAWLTGMSPRDSIILGFGMSPRGEVAMIVGLLALETGFLGQDAFVAIVLMSLLTTVITPLVYRNWFYRQRAS